MRYIEAQFRFLYFAMLVNFVIFGVTLTIIGATLPKIIVDFHWSYTAAGIAMSAGSVGYFISTFVSGVLLQWLSPRLIVVAGLAIQAVGLLLFGARPSVLLNLPLTFMIGLGQGGTEVVVNLAVVRIERDGESRLMNLMHAAFAVGAIIGPIAAGRIMESSWGWQAMYRLMGLVVILMAGAISLLPFSRIEREKSEKSEDKLRLIQILKNPLLVLSFLVLFLYVGTELGVSSWVAEYYVRFLGTSVSVGAYMVSIFWIGLLVGRLALSGYRGQRQAELILILASTCTLALSFAILMNGPWLAGFGFFMAGLGFSAIYPLVITLVGKYIKQGQGAAIGFVATGGGVGAFAFPFFMATISDRFGIQRGFLFYIALDLIMTALACVVIWQIRKLSQPQDS